MRIVLKPDGRLIFVEHGRSEDARVRDLARSHNAVLEANWSGCHLGRKVDDFITGAGFRIMEQNTFYLPGSRPMTYTYRGSQLGICVNDFGENLLDYCWTLRCK